MMLVECCSQERSYLRFYGLLGQVRPPSRVLLASLPLSLSSSSSSPFSVPLSPEVLSAQSGVGGGF